MQARLARRFAVSVLVPVAVVLAASAVEARATPVRSGPVRVSGARLVVTPNWSGYVVSAPVASTYAHPYFTEATGTWTIPAARCAHGKGAGSSAVWVGLGGYRSVYEPNGNAPPATLNQEEVGTDSNCTAAGKPSYYAWFELVPYPSFRPFPAARDRVSAGDTMTGLVRVLSPTLIELQLRDRTRAWAFTTKITFSTQGASTADWVVEAPDDCVDYACTEANLANFGLVTMRKISAVAVGMAGTLTDPRWSLARVALVPSNLLIPAYNDAASTASGGHEGHAQSPAGATPGKPSRDGRSFSVKWQPIATRGV